MKAPALDVPSHLWLAFRAPGGSPRDLYETLVRLPKARHEYLALGSHESTMLQAPSAVFGLFFERLGGRDRTEMRQISLP